MAKYRLKPVEVEARQLTKKNMAEIMAWINETGENAVPSYQPSPGGIQFTGIRPSKLAFPGHVVVKHGDNDFSAMYARDFLQAYEEAK